MSAALVTYYVTNRRLRASPGGRPVRAAAAVRADGVRADGDMCELLTRRSEGSPRDEGVASP